MRGKKLFVYLGIVAALILASANGAAYGPNPDESDDNEIIYLSNGDIRYYDLDSGADNLIDSGSYDSIGGASDFTGDGTKEIYWQDSTEAGYIHWENASKVILQTDSDSNGNTPNEYSISSFNDYDKDGDLDVGYSAPYGGDFGHMVDSNGNKEDLDGLEYGSGVSDWDNDGKMEMMSWDSNALETVYWDGSYWTRENYNGNLDDWGTDVNVEVDDYAGGDNVTFLKNTTGGTIDRYNLNTDSSKQGDSVSFGHFAGVFDVDNDGNVDEIIADDGNYYDLDTSAVSVSNPTEFTTNTVDRVGGLENLDQDQIDAAPTINDVNITPSSPTLDDSVDISADVTDDNSVSSVLANVTEDGNLLARDIQLTDGNNDNVYDQTDAFTANKTGDYTVKVVAEDDGGQTTSDSSTTFTVSNTAPTIDTVNRTPQSVLVNDQVNYNVTVSDSENNIDNVTAEVVEDGVTETSNDPLTYNSNEVQYEYSFTADDNVQYNVTFTANDNDGLSDSQEDTFTASFGTSPNVTSYDLNAETSFGSPETDSYEVTGSELQTSPSLSSYSLSGQRSGVVFNIISVAGIIFLLSVLGISAAFGIGRR